MPTPYRSVLLLVLLFAASCGGPPEAAENPEPQADPGRDVRFHSSDGVELSGRLYGDGSVAVLFAHMYPADATSWYPTAEEVADLGYLTLAFDFRGYGDSEGRRDPSHAVRDLRGAFEFLEAEGAETITLVGASMGGTAAIMLAAMVDTPAVVSLSAPLQFHALDAEDAAPDVEAPVLLIAAQDDEQAHDALRVLARELPDATTRTFEGEAHGTNLLLNDSDVLRMLRSFLLELAPPSGATEDP